MSRPSYSVYFLTGTFVTRLDVGPEGDFWSRPVDLLAVWPALGLTATVNSPDEPLVERAWQVTETVVTLRLRRGGGRAYLDLRRGCLVPDVPPHQSSATEMYRGAAVGPGPTVLRIDPTWTEAWTVHVPTGARTPSFPLRFGTSWVRDPFVVLPSPASEDRRVLYSFLWSGQPGEPGKVYGVDFADPDGGDLTDAAGVFPGLAGLGGVVDGAWVAYGQFDVPAGARFTRHLPDRFFGALADVATKHRVDSLDLVAVLDAESGLQPEAYHPAGRFGLLQVAAADLPAGVLDSLDEILDWTATRQLEIVQYRLEHMAASGAASAAHLWAGVLVPGFDVTAAGAQTVVAAQSSDPDLYQRLARVDTAASGQVTLGDMAAFLDALRMGPRWNEIHLRTWQTPLG